MAIDAGRFDPIPAKIYQPQMEYVKKEPKVHDVYLNKRFIRFPISSRDQNNLEFPIQKQQTSVGYIRIRMRRDRFTETIDASMEIRHRGKTYGIVSIPPIMDLDEVEFNCIFKNEVTVVAYSA